VKRILLTLVLLANTAPQLPALTSYWEDANQQAVFVVEGEGYAMRVATQPARILSLRAGNREMLGPAGAVPWAESAGQRVMPAAKDLVPDWDVHTGQKMKPATSSRARMNVWRASPHYWEIHLRDIPFVPDSAAEKPLRGHLVIHAHPDRAHFELRFEPEDGPAPMAAGWTAPVTDASLGAAERRKILRAPGIAVLAPPGGEFTRDGREWRARAGAAWWVVRPFVEAKSDGGLFAEEIDPLPAADFTADDGWWPGYEARSGLYILEMTAHRGAFTFENAWKVPSRRMVTPVTVPVPPEPRGITVMARTGTGNLEAGAVTDPHGFPRAIPAFVAKNFAGENEEPDDRAFGDIIFPLALGPEEPREHLVMGLYQTWGRLMLKQVSSIRFFNIYWHLSTGLSETTCFTHAWMNIRDTLVSIPDFRPYSGPFLMGQPQHDCFSWPGFLNYETEEGTVRPMYRRTEFHSIAPCLAHFTMHFGTADDTADMTVESWEIPQTDEARTFLRIRYRWDKPATVAGDARKHFRWLQMFEKYPARDFVWLDGDGKERTVPAKPGSKFPIGAPLAAEWPYAGAHEGRNNFGTLMLVTRLEGQLGGQKVTRTHVTADFGKENGTYAFTTGSKSLRLQPGDFLEADIVLMPHGEVTTPFHKPNREREHWGKRPPVLSQVTRGTKVRDFPATVRADDDAATFRVTGGLNMLPLVVEGFTGRAVPLLWKDGLWQDQQQHGGDGYQVDASADGTFRFTFNYAIRGTEEHDLAVSLLRAGAPVTSLRDRNGLPVVTATAETDFRLASPALFAPGRNELAPGRLTIFSGRAKEIAAVPVSFIPRDQSAVVECAAWDPERIAMTIEGSGRLEVGHRIRGRHYRVRIGTEEQRLTADSDTMTFDVPPGRHQVLITTIP
jgi:hypothetical protein